MGILNCCAILAVLVAILVGYGYLNKPQLYEFAVKRTFSQYKYGTLCLQYTDRNNLIERFGVSSTPTSECDETMIIANSSLFFETIATAGGSIGLGEAYFESIWDVDNSSNVDALSDTVYHILWNSFHLDMRPSIEKPFTFLKYIINSIFEYKVLIVWLNRIFKETKTIEEDILDIEYHYDKGYTFGYDITTEFWESYLGPTRTGSCAIWDKYTKTLEDAQNNKWYIIINKLDITPDDSVLDVGSGWGYACSKINNDTFANCTGITLSKDQLEASNIKWNSQLCSSRSPDDISQYGCIQFIFLDYRQSYRQFGAHGIFFSKIVSVGMVEHVGYRRIDEYFEVLSSVLQYNGKMLVHGITMDDLYPNFKPVTRQTVCTHPNFIAKYIFPGGCILHPDIMVESAMNYGHLEIIHRENYGKHYARTLNVWLENMRRNWSGLKDKSNFDIRFFKLNEFYLAMCEALFRSSRVELTHFLFVKPEMTSDRKNRRGYDSKFYMKRYIMNPNVGMKRLERCWDEKESCTQKE